MEQLGYVEALELERVKLLVFQRELPLSIELVSRVIETYRQHPHLSESLSKETTCNNDDCGAVLELIPSTTNLTNTYPYSPESKDHLQDLNQKPCPSEKSDWLRSVQLWNQTPDDLLNETSKKESNDQTRKECGNTTAEKSTESSSMDHVKDDQSERDGGISKKDKDNDKEENAKRKQRRCWSQELHRRFLHSLQQLGGAHVATPKQIRELMKVDALTNDEVKSHLQKYRLHTRRPTMLPAYKNNGRKDQAPQFVVVGGIWVPQSDQSPTMISAKRDEISRVSVSVRNECYTPTAALLVQSHHPWETLNHPITQVIKTNKNSEGHGGDTLVRCFSTSTSSSTRTTSSPVY